MLKVSNILPELFWTVSFIYNFISIIMTDNVYRNIIDADYV